MKKQQQIEKAKELGRAAFASGKHIAPILNAELEAMCAGRGIGETPKGEASTIAICKAYTNAYVAAMLAS